MNDAFDDPLNDPLMELEEPKAPVQKQVERESPKPQLPRWRWWHFLAFPILTVGHPDHTRSQRFLEGILWRVLLLPVLGMAFMLFLVWATTHPVRSHARMTPEILGLYGREVSLTSRDGVSLSGWYLPPLSLEDVLIQGDVALLKRWPGVVMVHGLGTSHDLFWSQAQLLHEKGYGVLLLSTRGQGESGNAAVSFGLRETMDVHAGIAYLKGRRDIDPQRLALIGQGYGAAACLRAAREDSTISAIVAQGPIRSFREEISENLGHWTIPSLMYRMGFEVLYGLPLEGLELETLVDDLRHQSLLWVAREDQPDAMPDLLRLAGLSPGRHQVWPQERLGELDPAVVGFLSKELRWDSEWEKLSEPLRRMLKARVGPTDVASRQHRPAK